MTPDKRTRIFIGILLIYAAGIAFLMYRLLADIDPRYRESAEESLVETSQLMASLVEQDVIAGGAINTDALAAAVPLALCAPVLGADLRPAQDAASSCACTSTDRSGRVLFDSHRAAAPAPTTRTGAT